MNPILTTPLARVLFKLLRIFGLVYIGFMIYLAIYQRRALYYPDRATQDNLVNIAHRNGFSPWQTADNKGIGWKPSGPIPSGADILLAFHGNAGFALHRTYLADGFQRPAEAPAFHVFLLEYPGYGARAGSPTENALRQAAADAFRQLQQDHPESRIFLVGESLGSGVAAWLAGEHPEDIAGIFLITAFNRLVDVAQHHYPVFPISLLLRDRFESVKALAPYRGPVGFLLAGNDTVIPARFGIALYESYPGPKQLWMQETSGHNSLDYREEAPWWSEVTRFLREHTR